MGIVLDIWSTLNFIVVLSILILWFYKTIRKKDGEDCLNNIRYIPGPIAIPIVGTYWVRVNAFELLDTF